jgi:hypothetical protein
VYSTGEVPAAWFQMLRRDCLAVISVKERGLQSGTTVIAEEKLHGCGSCTGEVLTALAYGSCKEETALLLPVCKRGACILGVAKNMRFILLLLMYQRGACSMGLAVKGNCKAASIYRRGFLQHGPSCKEKTA